MRRKRLLKTISYQVISTLLSFLIGYMISGQLDTAMIFTVANLIVKTVFYFVHETIWEKL